MTDAETKAFESWYEQSEPGKLPQVAWVSQGGLRSALMEAWEAGSQHGRESALLEGGAPLPVPLAFGPMGPE
jgi:hypothetical protein